MLLNWVFCDIKYLIKLLRPKNCRKLFGNNILKQNKINLEMKLRLVHEGNSNIFVLPENQMIMDNISARRKSVIYLIYTIKKEGTIS